MKSILTFSFAAIAIVALLGQVSIAQDAPVKPAEAKNATDIHASRVGLSTAELMNMDLGDEIESTTDIQYGDDKDVWRRLDIHKPTKLNGEAIKAGTKLPVVVFFHGGNWMAFGGDKRHGKAIATGLCHEGFMVVSITYRGADGSKASQYPRYVKDCAEGVAWVVENIADHDGDKDRLFFAGHSAGGHLAALLAYDQKWLNKHDIKSNELVKGVVGISGIYYIPSNEDSEAFQMVAQMLNTPYPTRASARRAASPIRHITKKDPATLLLYGENDMEHLDTVALGCWVTLKAYGIETSQHMIAEETHEDMLRNFGVKDNDTTIKTVAFLKKRLAVIEAK